MLEIVNRNISLNFVMSMLVHLRVLLSVAEEEGLGAQVTTGRI